MISFGIVKNFSPQNKNYKLLYFSKLGVFLNFVELNLSTFKLYKNEVLTHTVRSSFGNYLDPPSYGKTLL